MKLTKEDIGKIFWVDAVFVDWHYIGPAKLMNVLAKNKPFHYSCRLIRDDWAGVHYLRADEIKHRMGD